MNQFLFSAGVASIFIGWTLVAIMLVAYVRALNGMKAHLLSHGKPAMFKVLTITSTSTVANNSPVVRFVLEVYPPGAPPYQLRKSMAVPVIFFGRLQPGSVVPGTIDPQHPDKIALDLGRIPTLEEQASAARIQSQPLLPDNTLIIDATTSREAFYFGIGLIIFCVLLIAGILMIVYSSVPVHLGE